MKKIVDGNGATSNIAHFYSEMCFVYPITPSSPMASGVNSNIENKIPNIFNEMTKIYEMQSEAGVAGAMHGALINGTLTSTFTSSQGLLLMLPNIYKMAGEALPGVFHVASRTIATNALSIFGDHSDIYAARSTGSAIIIGANPNDCENLAVISHLSAIKGSLPVIHAFDGFRTSHEINTINSFSPDELLKLTDFSLINNFKKDNIINSNYERGMAFNEDIYFQTMEGRNNLYNEFPDIVNEYMKKINELKNTSYAPFTFYGSPLATDIIIAMGSVTDTIKLVVDKLNLMGRNVGVITSYLYRPFSKKYLKAVLPKTVKNIAVLDRTKEGGSIGEPLYLDVVSALNDTHIKIINGRYGLSSKNTTPEQINAVFSNLNSNQITNFTIGINDDVTNLSLKEESIEIDLNTNNILIYGYGSDGMVSASKDIIKIIGSNTNKYVQGYFQYDSKKSGGLTISHLRLGDKQINAPYYIQNADLLVITDDDYLAKYDFNCVNKFATVIVNTNKAMSSLEKIISNYNKKIFNEYDVKFILVDANLIACNNHLTGKISKIMESIILDYLGFNELKNILIDSIKHKFMTKGENIVNSNINAISNININNIGQYHFENVLIDSNSYTALELINKGLGNKLSVKDLLPYCTGKFIRNNSETLVSNHSDYVPTWISDKCIECNMCSAVCPHAVIKPIVNKESGIPLLENKELLFKISIDKTKCTGCGLCSKVCPNKALVMNRNDLINEEHVNEVKYHGNKNILKYTQFEDSLFKNHYACSGCGETNYIKLLTQLFGHELVIANATGCSSIYGGSAPVTPYDIPWSNSLFEDNAEYGLGLYSSYVINREKIINIINNTIDSVTEDVKELFNKYLTNIDDYQITKEISEQLVNKEIPKELKTTLDQMVKKSIWCIGGDGWAYDIGFGGIDHVLSSNLDINILVLDTETYSNTGGQTSKATPIGSVGEFANLGKRTNKKDLFKIAMCYPNCYVASVSFGANMNQTIKALKEAHDHKGPSIIIAYAPCIEHGISGGMSNSINEQKLVVESGHTLLMRYHNDILYMDSLEPDFSKLEELYNNEVRFHALKIKDERLANELLASNKIYLEKRYDYFKKIAQ